MKKTKRLQVIFFVICTVALLVPFIYAGTVNTINASANNPGGGSRPYTATYNSSHSGTVTLSSQETGNYDIRHELRYPNDSVKAYSTGSGSLNTTVTSFDRNLSDSTGNWTISNPAPAGTYKHKAYTNITVPGESKSTTDTQTFSIN